MWFYGIVCLNYNTPPSLFHMHLEKKKILWSSSGGKALRLKNPRKQAYSVTPTPSPVEAGCARTALRGFLLGRHLDGSPNLVGI